MYRPSNYREKNFLEAILVRNFDKIHSLLNGAIDPNTRFISDGTTPLENGIKSGNPKIIRIILDAGADPNLKDTYGHTPLSHAFEILLNPQVIDTLIKYGADPNISDRWGRTPYNILESKRRSITPFLYQEYLTILNSYNDIKDPGFD
jgi:ankyrin repeat protein